MRRSEFGKEINWRSEFQFGLGRKEIGLMMIFGILILNGSVITIKGDYLIVDYKYVFIFLLFYWIFPIYFDHKFANVQPCYEICIYKRESKRLNNKIIDWLHSGMLINK